MLSLRQLADIHDQHKTLASLPVREFSINGRDFPFNERPAIMGVINLSPDSWYRESVCLSAESAVRRGLTLSAQGADIIDLGAESTLLDAERIDDSTQTGKLLPVLKELHAAGVLVSVETYYSSVARVCLDAGASVLNLTGQPESPDIYQMAAAAGAAVIVCYVQGENVREVDDFTFGDDTVADMRDYFARQLDLASKAGLEQIFIDPGMGFYYRNLADSEGRVRHQIDVFLNTFRLRELGVPICHALPHSFETFGEEVRIAEPFFAVLAALGGTNLFRTHEVSKTKAVLDTMRLV